MELKILCPYWGREALGAQAFLDGALAEGYDGVEINFPDSPGFTEQFAEALAAIRAERPGFAFIAQLVPGASVEIPEAFQRRYEERLRFLLALRPDAINAHTGKDHYSFEDNCRIIAAADAIAADSGIPLFHEIHRGRFSFHLAGLLPYLERFPALRLTGDFSHFCTVSESLLEDQEEALAHVFPFVQHLHARVGGAQGPQAADPFAPEWSAALARYGSWWRAVLQDAEARGRKHFTITPEAGPAPYMPLQPYSGAPLADQYQINIRMKDHLRYTFQPKVL
ncbi:sugar phosphate isomerase/epimerase [Flaviaesturariibacter aridisoli]|uniref:Sugar phosphate isomerase/epimerase n=1 Tax=Flaviaesturariibacter aridisoli TaxID=2545761 RepID=A0A4R4DYR2_9BACT|nr:sugar phosphate isomerase/epimerase [Flaviaesturariibacter aridisoli]TCZ67070.1 sugar phosphate isomerase/epimerase [Flaviaesturariibacter aridisoli]